MRYLVRTEVGLVVAFAVGMLVTYVGLALTVSGISGPDRFVGWLVLAAGLWLMLAAPVVHDRGHRERGEDSHALWGRDDRRKPPWLRAR